MVAIAWWFWLYKPKLVNAKDAYISIVLENGVYLPSRISVPANKAVNLEFLRKDSSPCAGLVIFPDIGVSVLLPLNKTQQVLLPAMKSGVYAFTCQMQMYRGEIVVGE